MRREASHHADVARLRAELAEKERVIERISDFLLLADCDCPDWCSEQQRCGFCSITEIIEAALASGGEQGQGEGRGEDVPGVGGHTGQRFDSAPPQPSPDSPVCEWIVRPIVTDKEEG